MAVAYQNPLTQASRSEGAGRRAVGYPRVSTGAQHEQGYGERDQAERIAAHMALRGYQTVEMVVDAVSGRTDDRPGLNRIRELARTGAIDVVVCGRLDRLARGEGGYLGGLIEAELKEFGVRVEYAEQEFPDTPEGELQKGILRALAGYECALIAARTKGGRARKAKERSVMPIGVRLFGYRQVSRAEAAAIPEFADRSGELLIIPEEAEIVREAFRRYAAGETIWRIAQWLDSTGVRPIRSGTWQRSTVHRMLGNATYTGKSFFGKKECRTSGKRSESGKSMVVTRKERSRDEWINVCCPAIVDAATFAAVQARLSENRMMRSGRPSLNWPLVGATVCGACTGEQNQPLSVCGSPNSQKGKTFRYYRCSSATRRDVPWCGARINADRLEEMARIAIRRALEPGFLADLAREEARRALAEAGDPQARERHIAAQLAALSEREKNLLLRSLEGGFDAAMTREVVAGIHANRAALENELVAVRSQAARLRDPEVAAREADGLAERLSEDLENALSDPARFKALARELLSIRLFPGGREPEVTIRVPAA